MQHSSNDPFNQIPWFATSHGHIDLQTSKDWRAQDQGHKKEKKAESDTVLKDKSEDIAKEKEKTSAGSNQRRKPSSSSNKVGVGGLPPLVEQNRGRPSATIIEQSSPLPPKDYPPITNKEHVSSDIIDNIKVYNQKEI
jgi:hypothetical protein